MPCQQLDEHRARHSRVTLAKPGVAVRPVERLGGHQKSWIDEVAVQG